ncbi:MAG: restriction endonuclease subunit S, partial [Smithellaceae bacterium]
MLPLPPLAEQQRIVAKIEELFSSLDKGIESLKTAQQQLKVYRQSVLKWAFEGKLTKSTLRQAQGAVIPVAQGTVKPVTQGAVMPVAKGAVMPVAQDAVKPVAEPVEATNKESEFPEGWEWVKIEDVADMQAGIAFKKSEYSSHGVRLFQIANVSFNFIKWEEIEYLPVKYIDQYPELLLNIGDIVMALNRPMLNNQLKIAEIRKDDVPAILYQRVGRFKFFGNLFNRYFLYYLQSPLFIRWLNEQLQGVNIPFINKAKLLRYDRFPLPSSIEEQHRIVAEIESRLSVCDKIEESIEESLR